MIQNYIVRNFSAKLLRISKSSNYKYVFKILLFSLISGSSYGQIWVNNITTGQPINTYYLGDKLPVGMYYQYEIGQAGWDSSQAGLGQNSDASTGWNWDTASYYSDGSGANKKVQRDFGNFQFTATGIWYITGRAKANPGDAWTYSDESWNNNGTFSTSTSAYNTVNALNTPTAQTATMASTTSINLSWSKDVQGHNVMIVRSIDNTFTSPTQGTSYAVNSTALGGDTVVYNSNGISFTDTGLTTGTTYYYAFYSENYSYYSTSVTANNPVLTPTPSGERDANDGNYDPTAVNSSGIYESYMGVLVEDETGAPISGLNRVFDMDGALSSSNGTNFDFGTQNPGLFFNIGTESKIFTKGTHKDCGCSSWYYVYKSTDANPVATDFPLPAAGSLFTNQINGKFTLLNSSTNLGSNQVFSRTTPETALGSTSTTAYNSIISAATTIKYKDYTDPTVGVVSTINNPLNTVLCPTCSGTYKVAIAMLAWVSTSNDCSNAASLIYHRDINKNKITDDGVVLNPNHPSAPASGAGSSTKNTLSGTDLFYVSQVTIGAQNGTKTWNGSWSPPGAPTVRNDVVINSDYSTLNGSLSCNDMIIGDGVVLTLKGGTYIQALNTVTTTGTGKIIVENTGNFVQRCNEKTPSAYIEHTKTTAAKRNWDYEYWGSPIVQDLSSSIPSAFDIAYYWDGGNTGSEWQTVTPGSIPSGTGFITRVSNIAPYNVTPTAINWTISGTANNGVYTTAVKNYDAAPIDPASQTNYADYLDYALLANPYPCAIDAKTFLSDPRNNSIESTLYFWTAITTIQNTDYTGFDPYLYNYNPDDYATWNFTGGTATAGKAITDSSGNDNLKPTGKIASGQAFFVEVKNNGTVYFDNNMRLTDNVNTQFFKHIKKENKPLIPNKTNEDNSLKLKEGRIWLNISNKGYFRQMLLGYMKGATNEYDEQFDGLSYSDSPILIYTMSGDKDLVIQGRQLPFDEEEIVPIGYDSSVAADFYINIDETDGFLKDQKVYLKDKLLGIDHDLKQSPYLFSTTIGTFNNRFELHYTSKSLGVNEMDQTLDGVVVSANGNQIKVNSTQEDIASVFVYDITGKKLLSKNNINKNETVLDKLTRQNAMLLVKVRLTNSLEVTKKIIL